MTMYLKVPHVRENGVVKDATVQQVVAALGDLITEHELTVDSDLDYPCVEFPPRTRYFGSYCFIRDHLENAGFEVG
jgi:hypothetical protein